MQRRVGQAVGHPLGTMSSRIVRTSAGVMFTMLAIVFTGVPAMAESLILPFRFRLSAWSSRDAFPQLSQIFSWG